MHRRLKGMVKGKQSYEQVRWRTRPRCLESAVLDLSYSFTYEYFIGMTG